MYRFVLAWLLVGIVILLLVESYDVGYKKAKAEYDVPMVKTEMTPVKIHPVKPPVIKVNECPESFIIQTPPEKIPLDLPK